MYTQGMYEAAVRDPGMIELLVHDDGVVAPELDKIYRNRATHDPSDLDSARIALLNQELDHYAV
jgi:hypothetical protein